MSSLIIYGLKQGRISVKMADQIKSPGANLIGSRHNMVITNYYMFELIEENISTLENVFDPVHLHNITITTYSMCEN